MTNVPSKLWWTVSAMFALAISNQAPLQARGGGDIVVRAYTVGASQLFVERYTLRRSDLLEMDRRNVQGSRLSSREIQLGVEENLRLVESTQVDSAFSREITSSEEKVIGRAIRAMVDAPHSRIQVFSSGAKYRSINVPIRNAAEAFPELKEIPQVAAAWQLLADLDLLRKQAVEEDQ